MNEFPGCYRAQFLSADALGNVTCTVPSVTGNAPVTALSAGLFSDFLPAPGALGWVMFEGGDPSLPVWLGSARPVPADSIEAIAQTTAQTTVDDAPYATLVMNTNLSGVVYNPAVHRAIVWSGTVVFSSGGPFFGFTLPLIPAGYTGAWAINGDAAANSLTVLGIQSYTSTQFFAKTNASTVSPIRFNFGCTYWVNK